MVLELENISKSYFQKLALDDVSLSLKEGEIFGLLGPNGAGKTSIIRIINKIIQAEKGSVRFKKDLMLDRHLIHFGYLPEERGLYRTMTVKNHAYFLGRLRGMSNGDIKIQLNYWLEKFKITDWSNKRIEELSKGMAQKVQFICAVLHQPQVLILDEPFSGFDPINVELIQNELKMMRADGKTIMLSSHNMKSVEEICDRVALIHNSKKILEGSVTKIRDERKNGTYAIRFRGNMIGFVNALWTGFELIDKEILSENRFVAYVKMRNDNNFQDLLKTLIGQIEIEAAWEITPSMQEIFIELVKES
ncbi:MAG: ATP-binding cassette domain-containing protein [Bacteroidota bacterium]